MSTSRAIQGSEDGQSAADERVYVTLMVADQLFGVPIHSVQDVLGPQRINRIPLAPTEVAGSLNLRGRIVTAIDLRKRLGLPPRPADQPGMSVVVDLGGELYSLIMDAAGEVMSLPACAFEPNPATLDPLWQDVTSGVYQLEGRLLVVLAIERLLDFTRAKAA
jgi:purine-binding chemotaxis protein CheW